MKYRLVSFLFFLLAVCINIFTFYIADTCAFSVREVSAQTITNEVEMLYDSSGQRIARLDSGGEHVYYIDGHEIAVDSSGTVTSWKRNYGNAVRVKDGVEEKLYFITGDHLGSTTQVYDDQGKVVSQQVYYPYGSIRTSQDSLPTDKGYTGQISDVDETGLYYYNARYYNPTLAIFTQADKASDGLNKYAYVGGNPMNRTDPSGNRYDEQEGDEINIIQDPPPQPPLLDKVIKSLDLFEEFIKKINPVPLTYWGNNAKDLYVYYRDNLGWWNNYTENNFTPEDFMELILSYELGPLTEYNNNENFRSDVAEASTRWIYSKCEYESGVSCSNINPGAIFNWVGGALESFQRRWRAVFLDNEGYYKMFDLDTLNMVTSIEGRNQELADYIVGTIINPPDDRWKIASGNGVSDAPFYWGSESLFTVAPEKYLWKFGEGADAFYLLTFAQRKQADGVD